ncbi:FecR family protein [Steroidobacter sp.]|uniref:FecR family protein n=1 Tax=Steroidobacter sp. TaxID=1978227 RepID=UPI001A4FF4CA|nr:FecR domain-containing protein [Steroidobacter sp.]MBL8267756.1 FecR domain-containing protein [Steroidobacter sp.]
MQNHQDLSLVPAALDDEAAMWLARLDSGELSASDRSAYESWLAGDERRRVAIDGLARNWGQYDSLQALPDDAKQHLMQAASLVDQPRTSRVGIRNRRRVFMSMAAMLLVAVLVAVLLPRAPGDLYATSVGEHRSFTLADGSILTLNTNSRVRTHFVSEARELWLERGEAFFEVAHDKTRPFRVRVGEREVRAVGTAFGIRRQDDDFTVIVTEGIVEVAGRNESPSAVMKGNVTSTPPLRLTPGETLKATAHGTAAEPATASDATLAWREGLLEFNGDRLDHVVEEFGRYTRRRIVLMDDRVKQQQVGGVFKAGDVDALTTALDQMLPVEVINITPYLTLIKSAN